MIGDDLGPFFDVDEFAQACTRLRSGEADVPFVGILGEVDDEALDGHLLAGVRRLRFPAVSVNLLEGDLVRIGAAEYRVPQQARALNDGAESEVYLQPND